MIARSDGQLVRLEVAYDAGDTYRHIFDEYDEAERDYKANVGDLASTELRPYADRLHAAEDAVQDVFTETLDISRAELLNRMLYKAIVEAKVNRGDFARAWAR